MGEKRREPFKANAPARKATRANVHTVRLHVYSTTPCLVSFWRFSFFAGQGGDAETSQRRSRRVDDARDVVARTGTPHSLRGRNEHRACVSSPFTEADTSQMTPMASILGALWVVRLFICVAQGERFSQFFSSLALLSTGTLLSCSSLCHSQTLQLSVLAHASFLLYLSLSAKSSA